MYTKSHTVTDIRRSPILGIIEFLIYYIIFQYVFLHIFGFSIFRIIIALLCTCLLKVLLDSVRHFLTERWRASFYGTVYGKVEMKNSDTTTIPLKNIEISYNSPLLEKPGIPVFTDAKGRFRFNSVVPVHKPITLEAKIEKDQIIYEHIGKIEGVKWFLGQPLLGLPISSGNPKWVDFVVSSFSTD
ncbi:hypothetical protein JT359_10990 [Candidatus Poribacteria bacterium]|nr:hypothetical protein [Candidatus Poribacteria bacterium]